MTCPQCHTPAPAHALFCSRCGASLPTAAGREVRPLANAGMLGLLGDGGVRLLAYTLAGLVGFLLITALMRTIVGLALPVLVVVLVLYWVRERRRRYY